MARRKKVGFLIRAIALIIDGIIVSAINYAVLYFGLREAINFANPQPLPTNLYLVSVAIGVIYYVGLWTIANGQTLGKMIMGIKIIRTNGRRVNLGTAILRYVGYFISAIIFFLGYLWVIWDKNKQGWHDKIAGTYVVKA